MSITMKKAFAGALVMTVVTAFALPLANTEAAPSGAVTVGVSSASAAAGEAFSVNVTLSDVPSAGITAADFAVSYDPAVLTVTDVTEGPISKTGAAEQELAFDPDLAGTTIGGAEYSCLDWYIAEDQVRVLWTTGLEDSKYWIHEDGILLTITGTVKPNAPSGDTPLNIVPTARKVYPGSNADNTTVLFGYLDASGNPALYAAEKVGGKVTVTGGGTTPSVTTTDGTTPAGTTPGGMTSAFTGDEPPDGWVWFTPIYGDVDCKDGVELGDLILLNKFLVGKYPQLSRKSIINAATRQSNQNFDDGKSPAMLNSVDIVKYLTGANLADDCLIGKASVRVLVPAEN